jgi:hypothetical protein
MGRILGKSAGVAERVYGRAQRAEARKGGNSTRTRLPASAKGPMAKQSPNPNPKTSKVSIMVLRKSKWSVNQQLLV